jgi:hypothetical protein
MFYAVFGQLHSSIADFKKVKEVLEYGKKNKTTASLCIGLGNSGGKLPGRQKLCSNGFPNDES